MNKFFLTAVAAACLTGTATAQDGKENVVIPTPDPVMQEYNQVWDAWIKFNNWDKAAATQVMVQMETKVREEFPMDPQLKQTLDALEAQRVATLNAKAKELGYPDYKTAMSSGDERAHVLKYIDGEYFTQRSQLTSAYNEEFYRRYHAACIETMKRLMENADAMK